MTVINKHTCPLFAITLIRPSTASASPIIFKSCHTDDVSGKFKLCEARLLLKPEGNIYLHRHCFPDCNYNIYVKLYTSEKKTHQTLASNSSMSHKGKEEILSEQTNIRFLQNRH